MTCADVQERLDDCADGLLPESEFQEVELHLAGCAGCRAVERRLRSLLARAAALPREITPPRDLWPDLERRLRSTRVLPFARRIHAGPAWLAPALAAAAAVLALSVLTPRAPRSLTPTAGVTRPAAGVDGVAAAEAEYARATAELMQALESRRAALPAQTAAAVEQNLLAIDKALGEIRTALREDPRNPQLAQLLNATHRRKVSFLQQLVKLTTRL
jgi:anti-sigma factor RsiW